MRVVTLISTIALAGCERAGPAPRTPSSDSSPTDLTTSWLRTESGPVVGASAGSEAETPVGADRSVAAEGLAEMARELAAATVNAQRTLDEARRRFDASPQDRRDRWAIKWAAPVRRGPAAGQTEQVWVIPLRWTEHRVEGVLASEPLRPIGHEVRDLVGFPFDEVSDWLHTPDAPVFESKDGRREGGFTIAVLERFAGPLPR